MKNFLIPFLSILFMTSSYGQITFTKTPLNMQLISRDLATNTGEITIEGSVNNNGSNYQSIEVEILRDNVLINTISNNLTYVSDIASFNFNFSITAELANYSIRIYGKNNDVKTLEKEIVDIVSGDVYIIQGQSNAEARQFNGNADIYQNNFIRVYGGGFFDSSTPLEWYLGQGNGTGYTAGNVGQWGLKLANSIVNSTNIPVAIFNGANNGISLSFFLAPNDYMKSVNSNYGRLYYRLNHSGLKNNVRAILWSQGESDAVSSGTASLYKDKFLQLKNSWLTDYPNVEQIYIFQTKNSCDMPIEGLMIIKETQRQLADENSNITIIPTAAMTHHSDNCHFPLVNGYEMFSDRIYPLINRDLYGVATSLDIDSPMITKASLSNETTLMLETNSTTDLEIATIAENFEFSANIPTTITNINVLDNKIILSLSNYPGLDDLKISYLAQGQGLSGNFITNANGLELICFYQFPVESSTLSLENISNFNKNIKLYPNPTSQFILISGIENEENYIIYNTLGIEMIKGIISDNEKIEIKNFPNGFYFLKFNNGNTLKFIKE
ncbi:sialate O-acetylesterase [Algibacter sp. AS12]|uniref:sialate O-acetylesterase n=1 Tax=Algibacter sp. AS12 TaxID=3135773 RepID=UPI00398A820A